MCTLRLPIIVTCAISSSIFVVNNYSNSYSYLYSTMKIVILIHKNFEWIRTTIKRASHELMIMMKNKQSFRSVKSLENILKYFISFEWEKKKMFAYSFILSSTHSILSYPINLHHDCGSEITDSRTKRLSTRRMKTARRRRNQYEFFSSKRFINIVQERVFRNHKGRSNISFKNNI